jgi:hypothetical protein
VVVVQREMAARQQYHDEAFERHDAEMKVIKEAIAADTENIRALLRLVVCVTQNRHYGNVEFLRGHARGVPHRHSGRCLASGFITQGTASRRVSTRHARVRTPHN